MNKIYLISEFNDKMIKNLKEDILKLPSDFDKLYVYIDSDGGSVGVMKEILDILTPYKEKLVTIALKSCKSSATFIFLLGKERYVIEECEFLMHRPAYHIDEFCAHHERITVLLLEERLKPIKNDEKWMKEFYKTHYVPNDLIKRIFSSDRDTIVTVDALLGTGMATKVCKVDYNIIL